MDGNEIDFLEVHKGAALTEEFEVGGEDIVWVEMPMHSSLLRDNRLKYNGLEDTRRSIDETDLQELDGWSM